MGERKVLNKYIPADFDPKLVPRGSKPKDDLIPVRMMLPFTVQCSTCSDFMYRGRKFNSKKEPVKGSEGKYLGIQRWRFYIKCTACSRPVTFLTDPKNGDYEMESGGVRTYEVHKDKKRVMEQKEADDVRNEKLDPMKALENRVLASQKEMADLDNLDEIKAMNMRHLRMMSSRMNKKGSGANGAVKMDMDVADLVLMKTREDDEREKEQELELDEEDEALIKTIKFGKQFVNNSSIKSNSSINSSINKNDKNSNNSNENGESSKTMVRLSEKEEEEIQLRRIMEQKMMEKQQMDMLHKAQTNNSKTFNPLIKVKRKRKIQSTGNKSISNKKEKILIVQKKKEEQEPIPDVDDIDSGGGALGLLGGYGSDSS